MADRYAGDQAAELAAYGIDQGEAKTGKPKSAHPLDSDESREILRKCLEWYYLERDIQAENRMEMAVDHDFYDGMQWAPEDKALVNERGQMALVFNEVAPPVDWLIGTERRTRVDWKVLPRTEDDVQMADVKTKTMKYVSDINRSQFSRSKAFSDAVKGGLGWVDDGARDDPTQDILYSKYEDWRNVLWDSKSYELDLSDARYLFRWRWVDEDIAIAMMPDRADKIRASAEEQGASWWDGDDDTANGWYMGEQLDNGRLLASGSSTVADLDTRRRRVKLIECQYRQPVSSKIIDSGPWRGAFLGDADNLLQEHVAATGCGIIEKVAMRVHVAVFTESALLSHGVSGYRHNRFSLTPIWCYRRSRDRLPYGVVRRVRDIQQDLNKRASKALFMLNTNQVFAEKGAVDDQNKARAEVDRPDGFIEYAAGKKFDVRRDSEAAAGQVNMMTLDSQTIQRSIGVNNENLGRQTNAVSGAAIEARQNQGSVGTTEPFDNLRLAVQVQGEKVLSLTEQFYSEPKVIRLSGEKGRLEWVKINQPELQPDGSVRWIDDITASQADFKVSEADYAGTLRQVMFDSLNNLATRLPPEISLRLFTIAMEFSDLPNKDGIADAIRAITGERNPDKPMTPEEQQAQAVQQQQQQDAMAYQQELAMAALEEQRAKAREINAKAAEIEARTTAGGGDSEAVRQIQARAAEQIDRLSQELAKARVEMANQTAKIRSDADTAQEVAHINALSRERVAEIQAGSQERMAAIEARLNEIAGRVGGDQADTPGAERA